MKKYKTNNKFKPNNFSNFIKHKLTKHSKGNDCQINL